MYSYIDFLFDFIYWVLRWVCMCVYTYTEVLHLFYC